MASANLSELKLDELLVTKPARVKNHKVYNLILPIFKALLRQTPRWLNWKSKEYEIRNGGVMNSIEKEIELRSYHKIRQNKMNKDWLDIQRGTVSDIAQIFLLIWNRSKILFLILFALNSLFGFVTIKFEKSKRTSK